jgi:hypothetical protein
MHPGSLDAQAADTTESARAGPEGTERPRRRSIETSPSRVPADPRSIPRTRQSAREAGAVSAGSFATYLAPEPGGWNERTTRNLREARDVRDELDHARSTDGTGLATREMEASFGPIRTSGASAGAAESPNGSPMAKFPAAAA